MLRLLCSELDTDLYVHLRLNALPSQSLSPFEHINWILRISLMRQMRYIFMERTSNPISLILRSQTYSFFRSH